MFTLGESLRDSGNVGFGEPVSGVNPDLQNAASMQYSFSAERELGGNLGVRVSYIGSRGRQLPYRRNVNQPPPSTIPLTRPAPALSAVQHDRLCRKRREQQL